MSERFRKKTPEVEALFYDGEFPLEFLRDDEEVRSANRGYLNGDIHITSPRESVFAAVGYVIVRETDGTLTTWPVRDLFDATYEPADSTSHPPALDPEGEREADRLYHLLALFDTRDGSPLSHLVRAAREGYERSHSDMGEQENRDAWNEFDAIWDSYTMRERLDLAKPSPALDPEDRERLKKIAYGLETGYFRDESSAVANFASEAADLLRNLASHQGGGEEGHG